MGKAPKRNALTGCIRRGVKRDHSAYRRALHLSIKEVGLRDLLQRTMLFSGVMAQITLHQLSPVAVLRYLALNFARQYPTIAAASPIIDFLTKFLAAKHVIYRERFLKLFELDQELYDIPLDVQATFPSIRIPRQDVRIDSWTLQECYKNTAILPLHMPNCMKSTMSLSSTKLASMVTFVCILDTGTTPTAFTPRRSFSSC
jgi:hypothetical protein